MKYVDKASRAVAEACANGTHFDKATVHFVRHGETPMEYLEDPAGGRADRQRPDDRRTRTATTPMESVTLGCAKITKTYTEQKADGGQWLEGGGEYSIREDA